MNEASISRGIKIFWLYLFPIASYFFYTYVGFNSNITKAVYFAVLPLTMLYSVNQLFSNLKGRRYAKLLRALIAIMMIASLNALLFQDQGLIYSYRVTAIYLAIIYFFYLLSVRPSFQYVERLIWTFSIIYIVLWLYGLKQAPILVFGQENENGLDETRGLFRLFIPGASILTLAFFLALNKYIVTKKKKWIFLFSCLFLILVLHVVRQVILFSFIVGCFYIAYNTKWKWAIILGALLLYLFSNNIQFDDSSPIGKMLNITQEQATNQQSGGEDIRVTEYKYYFTEYSTNICTILFGNGVGHSETEFGKKDSKLANQQNLFANDVGYADIYTKFGIISLLIFALIFYKVFTQDVSSRHIYAKLYLTYLVLANIASSPILQDPITNSIALYVLELDNIQGFFKQHINIKSLNKIVA